MLVIFPDTNALHGNPYFKGKIAEDLLREVDLGDAELQFSPVVLKELQRHLNRMYSRPARRSESRGALTKGAVPGMASASPTVDSRSSAAPADLGRLGSPSGC